MSRFLKRGRIIIVASIVLLIITGCVARRDGVSWADLTLVGDDQNILVSFRDYMVLVDPVTGQPIPLTDSEGNVRMDEDGNPRPWEVKNDGSEFYASPLFLEDNETLLVADYNNRLLEVSFDSARVRDVNGVETPGHVIADLETNSDNSIVYLPLSERDLVAFDLDSLQELWRLETERGVWGNPMREGDILYFASIDHHLYAVNANTGSLIWDLELSGGIASAPLIADDRMYVGTFDRNIFAVSTDGEIIGEPFETEDWVWNTPVLLDGVIYATDLSGYVYAISLVDGEFDLIWKVQASEDGIRPSPIVTEDHVIVADRDGRIFWLRREDGQPFLVEGEDGLEPLERQVDAEVLSDMITIVWDDDIESSDDSEESTQRSDLLIVSTVNNSRVLVAFTLNDGARRWEYGR